MGKDPKQPAIQFYTGDWMKSADLAMCSPATRGIWIDAICAMHDSDRSGTLAGTPDQLVRVLRCSLPELQAAIAELKATGTAGVTERNGVVTLTNRRMKAIYDARVATRERVRKHRCNGDRNEDVTPYSSSSVSPSGKREGEKDPQIPPELDTPEFRNAWAEYVAYRKDRRLAALLPASVQRQFKAFVEWGGARVAVEQIGETVRNGYQGVFPPKPANGKHPASATSGGAREVPQSTRIEF
jgi:hypothetical protein